MKPLFTILKQKNLILLWLGQIVSQFGDRITQMALIAVVYQKAPGSTLKLASVLSFTILPLCIIGPAAGAFVDRWDRRRTMVFCDIARGILVLFIPLLLHLQTNLIPIYIIVFGIFSLGCFFVPAKLAIIPDIVSKEMLPMANAVNVTSGIIAAFGGLALGGLIVEAVGTTNGFFFDALTYFCSGICSVGIRVLPKTPLPSASKASHFLDFTMLVQTAQEWSFLVALKEGWVYMLRHPDVKYIIATLFFLMAVAGALYTVMIVFIQQTMGSVTRDLSLLSLFLGMGFCLGALWYGRWGKTQSLYRNIYYALLYLGGMIVLFSLCVKPYTPFCIPAALVSCMGMVASPVVIGSNTLVHENIHQDMRARTFTGMGIIMNSALFFSLWITAWLGEYITAKVLLIAIGIGTIGITLLGKYGFSYRKGK